MQLKYDLLHESNLEFVRNIYNFYVSNSTATFHTKPVSSEEIAANYQLNHKKYKTFVIYCDDKVAGFCGFVQYKNKDAYDRTAELFVYLNSENTGKGIGAKALHYIEKIATENGIKVFLSSITSENYASIKLFENNGYEKCAHLKNVGEKFGKILDVVIYEKEI